VHHQQHDDHLDEMGPVGDNEELDLDLVPFICPLPPGHADENGDNFALPLEFNVPVANEEVISIDISAAGPQVELSGASIVQSDEIGSAASPEIVLALAIEPANFVNLEIQPHEFDALYASDVPDMSQAA
jgi:hypothetical protein